MKRITVSKVGSIAKMKKTTKSSNRVKEMLYHTFHGNEATRYGILMEDVAQMDYITYQREKKSSTMLVTPHSKRNMTLSEACNSSFFF